MRHVGHLPRIITRCRSTKCKKDRYIYLPNTVLIQKCYKGKERERARDLGLSVYRNPCQQTADWRMSELYKWCTKTWTRLLLTKINFILLWNLHSDWLDSSGFVWTGLNMRHLTACDIANEFHDSAVKLTGFLCVRFYMPVQSTHIPNITRTILD